MIIKAIARLMLFFVVCTQMQFLQGYVYAQNVLEGKQESAIQKLDRVEKIIDSAITRLDKKITSSNKKEKLAQKDQEISEYIEATKTEISSQKNEKKILKIVDEAKKVVVLKVVSGVTSYESLEETISSEVAETQDEKYHALETLQESVEIGDEYSLIVKTKYTQQRVKKLFAKFDTTIQLKHMYDNDTYGFYEVLISRDSIFAQEILTEIEQGILPENFVGVTIVTPEVFSIEVSSKPKRLGVVSEKGEKRIDLTGEGISATWGVEKYNLYYDYTDISKQNSVTVGVIDTGIDRSHPDLQNNIIRGYDFVNDDTDASDDQGHGTHVAGTIAAGINGRGILGVNPYAKIMPLKICDARGFCPTYAVLRSLEYAKEKQLDIVNMSIGGSGNPHTSAICGAIDSAVSHGVIVVAAAGNNDIQSSKFIPGGCEKSITVGAVDEYLERARFSNYGDSVDIAAPGVDIYSTYPVNNRKYRTLNGTSMAAPHISGIVSIIKSYKPEVNREDIIQILQDNSDGISTDKPVGKFVNTEKLLAYLDPITEEEKREEEKKNEVIPKRSGGGGKDDAEVDDTITVLGSPKERVIEPLSDVNEGANIQTIDFGDGLPGDISTQSDLEITEAGVLEVTEEKKGDDIYVTHGGRYGLPYSNRGRIQNLTPSAQSIRDKYPLDSPEESYSGAIVYNFDLTTYEGGFVRLPEEVEDFNQKIIGRGAIGDLRIHDEEVSFRGGTEGYSELHLSDNDGNIKYVFKVTSRLAVTKYTIHLSDRVKVGLGYHDRVRHPEGNEIASLSNSGGDSELVGKKIGTTRIMHLRNRKYHATDFIVDVIPKPQPKKIYCNPPVGFDCIISAWNDGYRIITNDSRSIKVEVEDDYVKIIARASGQGKIFIESGIGDYDILELNYHIKPKSHRQFNCDIKNGVECVTNWWGKRGKYEYKVSTPGIIDMRVRKLRIGPTLKKEKLYIRGIAKGETEVYVYEYGDHTATFKVTVGDVVSPMRFSDGSFTLQQGEKKSVQILSGAGEYFVGEYDKNVVSAGVDDHGDETGEVDIRAENPGKTFVEIIGKYNQTRKLSVKVLDTVLRLSGYEITIPYGQTREIYVTESNGGIKSIKKSNKNIRVYKNGTSDQKQSISIKGKRLGESIVLLEDKEGNKATIKVTVGMPSSETGNENNGEDDFKAQKELDNLLDSFLQGLGLESTDGVEITGSTKYFDKYKSKLDRIINIYNLDSAKHDAIPGIVKKIDLVAGKIQAMSKLSDERRNDFVRVLEYLKVGLQGALNKIPKVIYTDKLGSGDIGGIYFQVSGKPDEVGVNFTNESGEIENIILEKQDDNIYVVAFSEESCKGCTDFVPYVKTDDIAYYSKNKTFAVNYGFDKIAVASTDSLEINNAGYQNFALNLQISWNWDGYNSAYDNAKTKLVDIKEEYGNALSIGVSLIPIVGEGYDILTLIGGKDPITGEELGKLGTILTIAGLASGIGSGKLAREAVDKAVEKISKELGLTINNVRLLLDEVVKDYQVRSVKEFVKLKEKLSLDKFISKVRYRAVFIKNGGQYIDDINGKVEDVMNHLMKPEFKTNSLTNITKYTGLHSLKELDVSQYIRNVDRTRFTDITNSPYLATISIKDGSGGIIEKKGNNGFSSMFPESWDRIRIKEEVTYAIHNNKGRYLQGADNEFYGFTKDGFQINFYLSFDNSITPSAVTRIGSSFPKIDN